MRAAPAQTATRKGRQATASAVRDGCVVPVERRAAGEVAGLGIRAAPLPALGLRGVETRTVRPQHRRRQDHDQQQPEPQGRPVQAQHGQGEAAADARGGAGGGVGGGEESRHARAFSSFSRSLGLSGLAALFGRSSAASASLPLFSSPASVSSVNRSGASGLRRWARSTSSRVGAAALPVVGQWAVRADQGGELAARVARFDDGVAGEVARRAGDQGVRGDQFLGVTAEPHTAAADEEEVVAGALEFGDDVRGHHDRSCPCSAASPMSAPGVSPPRQRVQVGHRFVEEHQLGPLAEGQGQCDAGALAAGEGPDLGGGVEGAVGALVGRRTRSVPRPAGPSGGAVQHAPRRSVGDRQLGRSGLPCAT